MRWVNLTLLAALVATAAAARSQERSSLPADDTGRVLFVQHCSACHGTSGRGDGPAADTFRTRPPDLTRLASRNGGVFAADRIHRVIDGRGVTAHGTPEMPVWGEVFRRKPNLDEDAVKARIEAIVRYLRSIQERSS